MQVLELNPKPFNAAEAMKKSIEIAKNKYPTGKIGSTKMVVYSYPKIGAMTVVKDTTVGDEYRIFVDAYTLNVVPDKPATETELGVWSMYEQKLKNGIDENLKEWQKSDQLTKSVEQEATNMGIDINVPITEEKMKKLSADTAITSLTSSKTLSVPLYGQQTSYYCAPASAQMIAKYYGVTHTQNYIYNMMGPTYTPDGLVYDSNQLHYYTPSTGLNKPNSVLVSSGLTFNSAVSEINNNRPYVSMTAVHSRACRGYSDNGFGLQYLAINDPWPVGSGTQTFEYFGSESRRVYVRS